MSARFALFCQKSLPMAAECVSNDEMATAEAQAVIAARGNLCRLMARCVTKRGQNQEMSSSEEFCQSRSQHRRLNAKLSHSNLRLHLNICQMRVLEPVYAHFIIPDTVLTGMVRLVWRCLRWSQMLLAMSVLAIIWYSGKNCFSCLLLAKFLLWRLQIFLLRTCLEKERLYCLMLLLRWIYCYSQNFEGLCRWWRAWSWMHVHRWGHARSWTCKVFYFVSYC